MIAPDSLTRIACFNTLATMINLWAYGKGFWDSNIDNGNLAPNQRVEFLRLQKSQKIALIGTEVSELLEGIRANTDSGLPGFTNEEEEAADIIIRVLDYCGQYQLRIGEAIEAKMDKNRDRPHKHAKEF